MTQIPVAWGATSKLLLTTFLASLIPTISEWISSGVMPTKETALSAILLAGLAVVRVVQQIVLDNMVKYTDVSVVEDPAVSDPQA
jgi:hypothetical protein